MSAQPKQRTADWYESRKGRITASRVGAILGVGKYRTAEDVMRDMVREHHGAEREFTGNEATRYGEAHEGDAIAAYEAETGEMVTPMPLVVHPDYGWLAASPDGAVGDDGLIECKAPMRAKYTEASDEYLAQMQLQLACTDRAWCDFVVWRDGEDPVIKRYERDLDWLTHNLAVLIEFSERYEKIVASKDLSAPYLASRDRNDDDWRIAVEAWQHAKREADDYASLEKQLRAELIALAPHGAKGCGVTVSRVETEGRIDYKRAITQMFPDVDLSPFHGKPSVSYRITESKA